ncbi:Protein NRT1/ PTR FAMILY 8.4 [Hondaea fermentalgiana]|uniref:Protein NRT1/ PTR FAMILY 8.4 n=1 Tax=Hondaea fermentalgiana TaxID=2315210 RepID=A0A2R5G4N4_9STRA|nr:Protein NRT1/ PTR FAMILY 8.4 [Hondaea fermentalgiana]|eukprot:GBG25279.1 Protein NRT1/ PTR FAMILY 8.4 [Hondaea fermentalgiana]
MLGKEQDLKVGRSDVPQQEEVMDSATVSPENDLPDDIRSEDQLSLVPEAYRSDNPKRPLKSKDAAGNEYTYVLKPMWYCVVLILLMELLERLSYYGINFTQTAYLTGSYGDWSPLLGSTQASSWVLTSTAIAYSVPFLGAIIADAFIGTYWTIILFTSFVYVPGLLLIALCAREQLWNGVYPQKLLAASLMGLYSAGAGGIKSCVNVLGAQQFHPLLQKAQISRYYVNFYMFINIGAIVGGIVIPLITQINVFGAYMIPVCCLALGLIAFIAGTRRYVRMKPQGSDILESLKAVGASFGHCPPNMEKVKVSRGGKYDDAFIEKVKIIGRLIPIMLATVPFNMAYGQMASVFVIQGTVMQNSGMIDASWMENFDAFSVIICGLLISRGLYPFLERRGIELHMTTKFSIGTFCGALAILTDTIIDYKIHSAYEATGEPISIWWQIFPYFFVGAGEIFAVSSAYDAAFQISPDGLKSFGSALNLFMVGAVPNFISDAILNGCEAWFTNDAGSTDISTLELYAQSKVYLYLWVLFAIAMFGTLGNLVPWFRTFYSCTEEASKNLVRATRKTVESNSLTESHAV